MSTSRENDPPLSANALRNLIEFAIANGYVEESEHAEKHHPERGLSVDDVLYGLKQKNWTIAKDPDYDSEHHNWEYLIRTVDIEGNPLEVKVAAYPQLKKIKIVTRW